MPKPPLPSFDAASATASASFDILGASVPPDEKPILDPRHLTEAQSARLAALIWPHVKTNALRLWISGAYQSPRHAIIAAMTMIDGQFHSSRITSEAFYKETDVLFQKAIHGDGL